MNVFLKFLVVTTCLAVTALCAGFAYKFWEEKEAARIKREKVQAWDAANRARLEELKKKWATPATPPKP